MKGRLSGSQPTLVSNEFTLLDVGGARGGPRHGRCRVCLRSHGSTRAEQSRHGAGPRARTRETPPDGQEGFSSLLRVFSAPINNIVHNIIISSVTQLFFHSSARCCSRVAVGAGMRRWSSAGRREKPVGKPGWVRRRPAAFREMTNVMETQQDFPLGSGLWLFPERCCFPFLPGR